MVLPAARRTANIVGRDDGKSAASLGNPRLEPNRHRRAEARLVGVDQVCKLNEIPFPMRAVTRFVLVVCKLNRLAAPHGEGLLVSNRGVEIHVPTVNYSVSYQNNIANECFHLRALSVMRSVHLYLASLDPGTSTLLK